MKGKVQTNRSGINVLVETATSGNRFIGSHHNAVISKILTKEEILDEYKNNISKEEMLQLAKGWISKQKGFAKSNISDGDITYGSIIQYN